MVQLRDPYYYYRRMSMKKMRGFTMMELMITIAIVGILATIAITSYRSHIMKANRSDALQTLLSIQLAEERYRMKNSSYGSLAQVWNGVSATTGGYYTIAISNTSATSYTITATATGSQTTDSEDGNSCATLSLAYSNNAVTKTPSACWMS
jgi:type IV pilus assembly protein PilE